LNAWHVIAQ